MFKIKNKCIAQYHPVLPTLQRIARDGETPGFPSGKNRGRVLCANPDQHIIGHELFFMLNILNNKTTYI